jgi:hypothetical protein
MHSAYGDEVTFGLEGNASMRLPDALCGQAVVGENSNYRIQFATHLVLCSLPHSACDAEVVPLPLALAAR